MKVISWTLDKYRENYGKRTRYSVLSDPYDVSVEHPRGVAAQVRLQLQICAFGSKNPRFIVKNCGNKVYYVQ